MFTLYFRSDKKLRSTAIIGYVAIALFTASPILSVVLASSIANNYGCILNEGDAHLCVIGGVDYGGFLYNLAVFGWFFMCSFPAGVIAFIVWTKKVRNGRRFLDQGASYAIADLENLMTREFDGRSYLEAEVDAEGKKTYLRIFFKDMDEQRKFTNRQGAYVSGLLKNDDNNPLTTMYNSIVTSQ